MWRRLGKLEILACSDPNHRVVIPPRYMLRRVVRFENIDTNATVSRSSILAAVNRTMAVTPAVVRGSHFPLVGR